MIRSKMVRSCVSIACNIRITFNVQPFHHSIDCCLYDVDDRYQSMSLLLQVNTPCRIPVPEACFKNELSLDLVLNIIFLCQTLAESVI